MSNLDYIEIECKNIEHLFNKNLILIVTATDIETNQTHLKLKPLSGYDKIIRVFEGDLTYYFGIFGNYTVAHVQSSMGSLSRDSSIMTISNALKRLRSRIVIMIGIAFGVDAEKQNIGDVLISESVIPYNSKRIGKRTTIQRGIEAPSSKILLNRFKNIKTTWEYSLSEDLKAKLIPTRLLSGEELIDNVKYRNKLVQDNPDSKGGEMEGVGVHAACDSVADWIIVKGICDYADGEKAKDKELRQTIAVNSALSACLEVFNSTTVFKDLEVQPIDLESKDSIDAQTNVNSVLFDIYDKTKEPFYIIRDEDKKFATTLIQYSVWLHGPVGCGKTNLIIRNLIEHRKNFIQISLAACIGLDIEYFFKEVLFELTSKTVGITLLIQPNNFLECSKSLLDLLSKHYNNKEIVIFIEEIPISSEDNYKEFSEKLFSFLISMNFIIGLERIRFVLSSINDPMKYVQIFHQKIHQQLNFMPLKYWEESEIASLISLIEQEISFTLPIDIKEDLIKKSLGSPRFIKKYFRNIHALNKTDRSTLTFLLNETNRELRQFINA